MSIIFGLSKSSEDIVTRQELLRLAAATNRFAPDGTSIAAQGRNGMGFQPYHTHERSRLESQPLIDIHGNLLVFDGRIDNYAELCDLLDIRDPGVPDSLVVLAGFRRWGQGCFSCLVGDWALALWGNIESALYLARDHAGTRTLYFEQIGETVLWSTYLETFFAESKTRELDESYAACYLASQPIRDMTPYKGIKAVPPAHYVRLTGGLAVHKAHWQWIATDRIHYRNDSEYDQHFLSLFRQSVERRTGPGAPILAQLSGGMDSTSIVCMSDKQRLARGASPADLLDTISFYDDSEPDWNERPYFSVVEAKRGKTDFHFDSSIFQRTLEPPLDTSGGDLLPGRDSSAIQREEAIEALIRGQGYRAILSGVGGDETLGGVPTPLPELADLLVAGDVPSLVTRCIAWGLPDRIPLIHMLFRTTAHVYRLYFPTHSLRGSLPPWIRPRLRSLCEEVLRNGVTHFARIGHRPSSLDNGLAWWSIMETLPHLNPDLLSRREYRYPYLDRDLVEFLFRVPAEQLLQPGRRRLLMRRALQGIVPDEIIERRRKAFVSRSAMKLLDSSQARVATLISGTRFVTEGSIGREQIERALHGAIQRQEGQWAQALLGTAFFALWLNSTTRLQRVTEGSCAT